MKLPRSAAALILLASISGVASAQNVITTSSPSGWAGFYVGANLGGVWNTTCNTWNASDSVLGPVGQNFLSQRNCPNGGAFVGGVQLGYNFQFGQFVWGLGLDWDFVSSKSKSQTYTVPAFPAEGISGGTLVLSGKVDPNGVVLLGPKFGYDFDGVLPYVRVGGVFASGQPSGSATYTDSVTGDVLSFSGSKNGKTSGYGLGAGLSWMAADPVSVNLEYTYINLGKSNSSVASCSGTPAACALFTNVTIQNFHNTLTASMVRLGVNYKFDF
jgi:outer membrane immunogenic protein